MLKAPQVESSSQRGRWRAIVAGSTVCSCCLLIACQKDEPPPPLPTPKVETAPEAPLELKPEDAGKPAVEEPEKKPRGKARPVGLTACCRALKQNAQTAPEPTKGYMLYAAQLCEGAVAQGQGRSTIVGMVRTALKGAGMPADCK
jgi:hypothetical protein